MNLNSGDRITGVARLVEVEVEKSAVTVEDDVENRADGVLAQAAEVVPPMPDDEIADLQSDDVEESGEETTEE